MVRRRSHPADLTDLHILVVEDNELNLEIAVFSLEAAGLNVSTAINGLEAVRLFEKSKPYEYDIILMDIMMPVMNGLDAAKAIRGLSRPDATTVPIIALSANAFAEDIQKSKNAGINEHLAKPLEMDKVLKVEDNELNLEIAVFSLEAAGLNVSTAINGLEAVRLFEKSKPYEYDIILMDIMMPVMNGLDAAKAIRGLSRPDATTVPIIALSANAFAEDIQKSKNAGINEHLAKPLEMDKVLKVIASYCK